MIFRFLIMSRLIFKNSTVNFFGPWWGLRPKIQNGRHARRWSGELFSYHSDFGPVGVESIVFGRCESDETILKSLRQTGLPVLAYRVARSRVFGIFTSFIRNLGSN